MASYILKIPPVFGPNVGSILVSRISTSPRREKMGFIKPNGNFK